MNFVGIAEYCWNRLEHDFQFILFVGTIKLAP